ncbi:MAG TPA: hypothetical protein VHA78_01070 [Candidatus Peribacteraceae bacterium]|nr:hypothetical protein [Candidatus Peribacteraceae bacterium]
MHSILRLLTSTTLVAGIMLTIGNAFIYTQADLTGGGATVSLHPAATSMLKTPAVVTNVLPAYEKANAADELVVGILLIMLGFFLHALVMSREERNVHITVKPSRRKVREWFWIEMRV